MLRLAVLEKSRLDIFNCTEVVIKKHSTRVVNPAPGGSRHKGKGVWLGGTLADLTLARKGPALANLGLCPLCPDMCACHMHMCMYVDDMSRHCPDTVDTGFEPCEFSGFGPLGGGPL